MKFTLFGRKSGTKIWDKSTDDIPGPGMYEPLAIKKSGKYPVSSFRNTTNTIKWENYKLGRFSPRSKNKIKKNNNKNKIND